MFLAKNVKKTRDGKRLAYYVIKESYWDSKERRQKQRHLAYVGKRPVLTLERALAICRKLECGLAELQGIRRLKIEGENRPEIGPKSARL